MASILAESARRFPTKDALVLGTVRVPYAAVWDQALRSSAQDQVWITHAGVARAADLISKGIREVNDASQWPKHAPAYGAWITLDL